MKKIYSLLFLVVSTLSFGQATELYFSKYGEGSSNNKFLEIYNGTGASVDLADYSVELYTNGASAAGSTQTFPVGTILASGDVYVLRNSGASNAAIIAAADITSGTCGFNGDDAIALKKLETIIDVFGAIGTDPGTSWPVGSTTVGTQDKTLIRKLSICSPNPVNLGSFGTDDATSEWNVFGIDAELGQLGSYSGCSTTPNISISAPANNTVFAPETTSVDINVTVNNFTVANGSGDGHINYTINGGATISKFDTTPIVLPTTQGNYTVFMQLVNNANQPLSPAASTTLNFTVASYNVVANLAALRADVVVNGANRYYQLSSAPVITYARTARNQKYIQDTTGGILIDDVAGTITTSFAAGDSMTGLKGQATLFSSLLQFVPTANASVGTSGNTVAIQAVTIADLNSSVTSALYESELVQLNNVTFDLTNPTFPTTALNMNVTNGTDTLVFRSIFTEADYMGTAKPTAATNIIVLVGRAGATAQVASRSASDLNAPFLSNSNFNSIDGLKMYPNPVANGKLFIETAANAERTVTVFDVLGKQVLNTISSENEINVSELNAGVYVVKITEEGKTATRKLVVR